jgi:FMN phosphatase YigB (HAD superfamily)
MTCRADIVFLFDVDNTLFDNDGFHDDLEARLRGDCGDKGTARYWAIYEELREQLSYADYIGALERYRLEDLYNPAVYRAANWILDYPFADHLYPHALDVVKRVRRWGEAVILSDGDAVFQPHKIARSGLWDAFDGNVLIYVHKERELAEVERRHPAERYVLVDDKASILAAVKGVWGDRLTTVFPMQGHYAAQATASERASADVTVGAIGDLLSRDFASLK